MDKKTTITVLLAVAAVILIGVFVATRGPSGGDQSATTGGAGGQSGTAVTPTRATAPANVVVPGTTSSAPADVALPQVIASASPNSTASYRSFTVTANAGEFTPNTIIVRQGDTTDINITAVDKDYDFTQPDYGFKVAIPKGQTKKIQFGATASGKYTFYCSSCGGPARGPVGYIVVASK